MPGASRLSLSPAAGPVVATVCVESTLPPASQLVASSLPGLKTMGWPPASVSYSTTPNSGTGFFPSEMPLTFSRTGKTTGNAPKNHGRTTKHRD